MLTLIVQFVASTAGVALVVALVRGFASLISDRGPRKRVEAIQNAHETLTALDGVAGAEVVQAHRDREIEALRRGAERREARHARWLRFSNLFARHVAATVGASSAALVGVVLALFALRSTDSPTSDLLSTLLVTLAGATAALTLLFAEAMARRRRILRAIAEYEHLRSQYGSDQL